MYGSDNVDIEEAMRRLEERMRSKRRQPRGRKEALAPYADQLRRYVEQGWTRKEIVAEMRALGVSVSTATLRDVLGIRAAKRRPKTSVSPVVASRTISAAPFAPAAHGFSETI